MQERLLPEHASPLDVIIDLRPPRVPKREIERGGRVFAGSDILNKRRMHETDHARGRLPQY